VKRQHLLKELIDTEDRYIASLEKCINEFQKPLKKARVLKPRQLRLLFCGIDGLLAFQQQLREDFRAAASNGTCIGSVFLKFVPYMKL